MKIMWFVNVLSPEIARDMGREVSNYGGWTHIFKKGISSDKMYEMSVCGFDSSINSMYHNVIDNISYYVIPKKKIQICNYDASIEPYIKSLLENVKPELIHVWGTEYPHIVAIEKYASESNIKLVYSIQGMISDCAKHYFDGLSNNIIYGLTFRDFLRMDNIYMQYKKLKKRGVYEKQVLSNAKYVIGRTTYDYSCVKEINEGVRYFFCNECLRKSFYESKWEINCAEKHSIFISQASYPIKGFHIFLDGLKIIKEKYPDVKVYVAGGTNPMDNSVKGQIRKGSYARMLERKIKNTGLTENIIFLGNLSEEEMKEQLLKSRVFVSPSVIENSSNSVGEAMLLGVPVVSSFVGGMRDMIQDGTSGLLYPANQPNMMARFIIQLFEDNELARNISNAEIDKAKVIYDIKNNVNEMKLIYGAIVSS